MPVVEVEVPVQQLVRVDLGQRLLRGEERLLLVDDRLHDAAHQLLPGREVVIERRLGDAELVGDLLQAGAVHALPGEQLPGGALDALLGVGRARHMATLPYLPIGKRVRLPIGK
jgi:hypothetical protein